MSKNVYLQQQEGKNKVKVSSILNKLPPYCGDFIKSITKKSSRTPLAYCQDLLLFFTFLAKNNPELSDIKKITPDDLDLLKPVDIEEFLEYITYGWYDDKNVGKMETINEEASQQRRLATLKSFFGYCYSHKIISDNPTDIVKLPELPKKDIIYLEPDEIASLVDVVESGEGLSPREQKFHELVKTRDLAIIILMLGTGIRVSECVALDINDIDLANTCMLVHRKEGLEMTLYYSDEVSSYLADYMDMRSNIIPKQGSETALFLSLQNSRMSVRSIERRVKHYSEIAVKLKHISPHKLRSSFATNFYRETNDIYALSNILGHSSIDVVKKYAYIGKEVRRSYRNAMKIRED